MAQRVKIVRSDGAAVDDNHGLQVQLLGHAQTHEDATRIGGVVYRPSISGPDLLPVATVSAVDNPAVAGSLTAAVHTVVVSAHTADGTSGKSLAATVTPTADKSADITIPQVGGAEFYRLYFCLCTPDPHFLIEITEAERAVGGVITLDAGTAVLTPNDPATPGVFTVTAFGGAGADSSVLTGLPNTAYVLPGAEPVDCSGHKYAVLTVVMTPTWTAPPDFVLVPVLQNTLGTWAAGDPQDLEPLSVSNPLRQTFRLRVDGAPGLHLLCREIAGCTVKVEVEKA